MSHYPAYDFYIRFDISGCGIILLFSSNQALFLSSTPYPPFGLLTVATIGLASYLLLIGISRAALSVSEDAGLRRQVRSVVNASQPTLTI